MTRKTINGVDVSQCKYFIKQTLHTANVCSDYQPDNNGFSPCKQHKDCYYKQLQRLEQKCEYIKQKAEKHKGYSPFAKMCFNELNNEDL